MKKKEILRLKYSCFLSLTFVLMQVKNVFTVIVFDNFQFLWILGKCFLIQYYLKMTYWRQS